ncbi:WXG100 family type VII secretion target [Nocardioides sp.]|uniref:WXG100 family type VII secretion target n=1 Tax=Nocardioides sp. TaxID=35761 RepID=UPI00260EF48D|nr:WXG100 family type VII secretion target [Nocardioides sp.]MDI6910506.1 WXG100 family type VII secretion target [Nocardioides sp.]
MSHAPEMGQGEGTLSRAAGLVAEARGDFDVLSKSLERQILAQQSAWVGSGGAAFFALHLAWTEKQRVITSALHEFEGSLASTERDFTRTDETQSSTYHRVAGRLG